MDNNREFRGNRGKLIFFCKYMDWLHNIKENYNRDYDTEIRGQLLNMSNDLGLGLTWHDIDLGYQNWYPSGLDITIPELKEIIENAMYVKYPGY